ncbi:lipopolysaccharide biosynthesis protein [Paenibacillus lycopersici]|uniref:Lipopolysaccharide biosynthesis protein n=1 Tax=Paenibacillus lycopersici TaxID=2704462 RepID=A0A6C0G078_9BACL|nr:Wzz/FepE/Etk N-terminal domain-containing protein [Paenibacillus lycopersici]QHT59910.1 lipopolysaccharide biosynthesis protein [Paenibacillus lycopersici]
MELEFKDISRVIKKRMWIIISLVLIACVVSGLLSKYYINPTYYASAKLIINNTNNVSGNAKIDLNTLNANIQLINTYKEVIKTPIILDQVVADHPELRLSSAGINSRMSVSSKAGSQVMTIGIQDTSQARAADVVNAVIETFKNEIPKLMKVDNVTILSKALHAKHPVPTSPNTKLNIIVAFLASLALSLFVVFMLEYVNDSIKTEKDIENMLNITVLAAITKSSKKDLLRHRRASTTQRGMGEKSLANNSN